MADNTSRAGTDGRKLRKDAEKNRSALIHAAAQLFGEKGLQPTLDDVAARAGVGVATAYRHFSNKYELAEAVLSISVEQMLAEAEAAAANDNAWDGLIEFMEASLRPQFEQRPLQEFLRNKFGSTKPDEVYQRIEACIDTLLDKGHRDGVFRDDVTSTDIGIACMSLAGLAEMYSEISATIWKRYVYVFAESFRAGSTTPLPGPALTREEYIAGMLRHRIA